MTSIQQDHIVLLVDNDFYENIPSWVTNNFTVTPGGYHEGQPSRNKLVIFADGTYLEFFNWYDTPPSLDNEQLPMRFWGAKRPGLIDFAITEASQSAEETVAKAHQRLSAGPDKDAGLGVKYGSPISGLGENTPGQKFFADGRIDMPFFCHDITPRTSRVPSHEVSKTTHPCGATGIAACEILVPKELLSEYSSVYSKILGSEPEPVPGQNVSALDIGAPQGSARSKVIIRAAESGKDVTRMNDRGIGFSDFVIAVKPGQFGGGKRRQLGSSGIESTLWLEEAKSE